MEPQEGIKLKTSVPCVPTELPPVRSGCWLKGLQRDPAFRPCDQTVSPLQALT